MKSLQKRLSVDRLDARMILSTRNSMRIVDESSSDSDDEPVVVLPYSARYSVSRCAVHNKGIAL